MNRENLRASQKKLKNKKTRTIMTNRLESLGDAINDKINDGDLVILNVERIMGRKDYPRMMAEYRQFVETNRNTIFVAHSHRSNADGFSALMELEGVEKWLFWYGDLCRVEKIEAKEDE